MAEGRGLPIAYVLIRTDIGVEKKVLEELRKLDGVEEAFLIFGPWDIIVKLNVEDRTELNRLVIWKIRRMEHITQTQTLSVIEEE
ncbi:Lrp/AsnC family transcriptional regulator [Candidatus Bathyarchaeota archaeon]|nr:MAG: Lrp/AsnC family transcriptional regulator [Candidatus Bathyarchaeota archaeon]